MKLARFLLPAQVAALKEAHLLTDEAMARYGITPEMAGREFQERRARELEAIERAERARPPFGISKESKCAD